MHSVAPVIPSVRITGKPSPLQKDVVYTEVQAGQSLAKMLEGVRWEAIRVEVEGRPVPQSEFETTFPKAGDSILVTAYLANDMSAEDAKTATTVGAIVITIVAAVVTAVTTYGVGLAVDVPVVAGLIGGLAGAAVSIAGNLILGAVIHIKQPPKPKDARQFYGIEGSSNTQRPYGTVPIVLGQLRMVPPLLTEVYSEWLGHNRTRTNALFDFGPGNLEISEVMIGDVPLVDLAYTSRWVIGTSPDWGLGDVFTNSINETLQAGAFPSVPNPSGTYTTSADTDEILLEIFFQQTPYKTEKNEVKSVNVEFNVSFRDVNGGTFDTVAHALTHAPNSTRLSPGQWQGWCTSTKNNDIWKGSTSIPGPSGNITVDSMNAVCAASPYEPLILTIKFRPPAPGQFEVIFQNYGIREADVAANPPANQEAIDIVDSAPVWTKMRSTKYTVVPAKLNTTKGSLIIQANQDINGTLGTVSAIVGQVIPVWNGTSWVTQVSSNPAFIYRWLLTGCPATRIPVATSRVDDDTIKTWATFCTSKGFVYNDVVDQQMTLYDLLQQVAAAGRASFAMRDGKYSVALETGQTAPVQVFTPRNSSEFAGARSFADPVQGLKIKFPNQDAEYQTDERVVYPNGYNEDGSGGNIAADPAKMGEIDLPGVTSPDAVWRLGRYHLAVTQLRQNEYSFKTGIEHLVCQRGDRIKVVHDVMNWGAAWGRITDLASIFTAHSSGVNDTLTPDPWDYNNSGSFTPPNLNTGYGMKFQLLAASKLVAVRVWTPPHTGGFNGNTQVTLWGPGVQPIARKIVSGLTGGQVNTVWLDVPVDLAVGEYAVEWLWYSTIPTNVPHVTNLYAIPYQHGPIYVPENAAFFNPQAAADVNPLGGTFSGEYRSIGYKGIDPVIVSDVNVVRNQDLISTTPSNPILQEFELDEGPQGNLFGAMAYVATIRTPKADLTDNLFNELYPHNAFLTLADFVRGSATGSYFDKDGNLLFTTASDVPRYTYDAAGLFSGLLLEPAATNSVLHSEDFDNASWTKTNVAVTPNQHTWPYKTGSADRIAATEANGRHEVLSNAITVSTFDHASASVFLHAGTARYAKVSVKRRDGTLSLGTVVDLVEGTVTNSAMIEPLADGWFRVGFVDGVASGVGQAQLVVSVMADATTESFVGNGESIYATGAQLEVRPSTASGHVTSYLPTGGSPTTRALEQVLLNLPTKYNRRGGLNPNRGTLVLEVDNRTAGTVDECTYLPFGDPSTKGSIFTYGELWRFGLHAAGKYAEAGNIVDGPYVGYGRHRVAVSWWENELDPTSLDVAISANGCPVSVVTLAAVDRANLFDTADTDFFIRQLGVFNPPAMTLRKLHIYGEANDGTGELEALSVVGASLPHEFAYWCGQEVPVHPIEGEVNYGDLVAIGSSEMLAHDLIVTRIAPQADLGATITCCDYNEDVYNYDNGTPPPFTSSIEIPPFKRAIEAPDLLNVVRWNTISSANNAASVYYEGVFHVQAPQRPAEIAKLEWEIVTLRYYDIPPGAGFAIPDGVSAGYPLAYGHAEDASFWIGSNGLKNVAGGISPMVTGFGTNATPSTGTDIKTNPFGKRRQTYNGVDYDEITYVELLCWYVGVHGQRSKYVSCRIPTFGTGVFPSSTTELDGTPISNISDGQCAFDSMSLTPTVNGIQVNWAVHNNTSYPNDFTYVVLRAPDVAGVAGTYAAIKSFVGPNLTGAFLDPVTDGLAYWYKVTAKVNFSGLAEAESTPAKAQAEDVGNVTSPFVKNPNFDMGDVAWHKGSGWHIIPKP